MISKEERQYFKSIRPNSQVRVITEKINKTDLRPLRGGSGYTEQMIRRVFKGLTKTNEDVERFIWDHYEDLKKYDESKRRAVEKMKKRKHSNHSSGSPGI